MCILDSLGLLLNDPLLPLVFCLAAIEAASRKDTFTLSFVKFFTPWPTFIEPVNLGSCGAVLFIVWFIPTAIACGSPQNTRVAATATTTAGTTTFLLRNLEFFIILK